MIIRSNLVPASFDAFTVWPFIFIRPGERDNVPLIAHEMVHYAEQRRCLTLPWLIAYFVSPKFRLAAELRAYKVQVAAGFSRARAAQYLMHYGIDITYAEAWGLLA